MTPAQRIILLGRPGWVAPRAFFDMDFARGRYFKFGLNQLVVSRASTGYAENTSGIYTLFAANAPRITSKGLLSEESRTNVVLWNRDLTNAAWTKSNVTAALDQVGVDGVAASASSIIATSDNGTCLQAITLASSARWQTAFVRRLVGTGNIDMTMDNGSTWTTVTVTPVWTRVAIATQTLANPTVGFRIVTSGDSVAIDFVQNENSGANATSPIAVTTVAVTRSADDMTLASPGLLGVAQGSLFTEWLDVPGAVSTARGLVNLVNVSGRSSAMHQVTSGNKANAFATDDAGATQYSLSSTSNVAANTVYRIASRYAANDSAAAMTASIQATVLTDATVSTITGPITTVRVGRGLSSSQYANGFLRRLAWAPVIVPDASLLAWAQAG